MIGSSILARISKPADNFVLYSGSGCFDLFTILIFILSVNLYVNHILTTSISCAKIAIFYELTCT